MTSEATIQPNTKILEAISRRAEARLISKDARGLRSLYLAAIKGAELASEYHEKLTGASLVPESPTKATEEVSPELEQERGKLAEMEQALNLLYLERDALLADKQMYRERSEKMGRQTAGGHEQEIARLEKRRALLDAREQDIDKREAEVTRRENALMLAAMEAEHPAGENEPVSAETAENGRYEARALRGYISAETSDLFAYVLAQGGIRPSSEDLREEYREIPPSYRRPDGMPGDEMAEQLATDRPELGIETERDLLEFFATRRRQARHARAMATA